MKLGAARWQPFAHRHEQPQSLRIRRGDGVGLPRDVCGLNPVEDAPGFRKAPLRPLPDARLPEASLVYESAVGAYETSWRMDGGMFEWKIPIPFGATARCVFPNADEKELCSEHGELSAELSAGAYTFVYMPVPAFAKKAEDGQAAS